MIDHTGVIVSDFAKSKAFYSAAFGAIGIAVLKEFPASVTGNTDVVGYGAKETTTQGRESGVLAGARRARMIPVQSRFRVSTTALLSMRFIKPHRRRRPSQRRARPATAVSLQLLWRFRP